MDLSAIFLDIFSKLKAFITAVIPTTDDQQALVVVVYNVCNILDTLTGIEIKQAPTWIYNLQAILEYVNVNTALTQNSTINTLYTYLKMRQEQLSKLLLDRQLFTLNDLSDIVTIAKFSVEVSYYGGITTGDDVIKLVLRNISDKL